MELLSEILKLVSEADNIYKKVISGNKNVEEELSLVVDKMVNCADRLEELNLDDKDLALAIITNFNSKIDLINLLLPKDLFNPNEIGMDYLRRTMESLEMKRFDIMNKYVMGSLIKEELDAFGEELEAFRKRVYEVIPEDDDILLEIAKMKSKIQHLNTEVLEDEEVLKVAYSNSN